MKRKVLSWLLVILWMVLIFYLSHQVATDSNGLSTGITEKILDILEKSPFNIKWDLEGLNHIVRKNAHFFAYFLLGILVINALTSGKPCINKTLIFAVLICVLYASSDEIHQLFIPGRGGQVKDVIIDSSGAIVGIFGYKSLTKKRRI